MKKYKFLLFIILITALMGFQLLLGEYQNGVEDDIYGKVVGQILDLETGEAVKEPFFIYIYDSKNDHYPDNLYRTEETDNQGKFELEVFPNTYCLQFNPQSVKSKYSQTPYPFSLKENERDIIKVETGKITYFKKKITIGGVLKIFLADMNNVPFNPEEKFKQKFTIRSYIGEETCRGIDSGTDTLNDGELMVYKLFTGRYWIDIKFEGLGFKDFKKKNILVESKKTTEVMINLDLTDITGIEGFVTDANGIPVEDSNVGFGVLESSSDDTIGYNAKTDKDGYYRLTGMPAGKYFLAYSFNRKTNRSGLTFIYGYVEIKKNVLRRLDIKFEKTIAEMENR